jgi:hypothetical protein
MEKAGQSPAEVPYKPHRKNDLHCKFSLQVSFASLAADLPQ